MGLTRHKSPHGTFMAVSMMKDEAPFLLEWFAHHLAVGFTDILVYTNDCTDGTVEMLQRLEELGLGHHRHNVIPEGKKPQPSAIAHAEAEPLVAAADWVMLFDADEFLCINHPSGTLDGMISDAVARGANGIVVTWRIFGSGFVQNWSRAPVTEQYLHAAPAEWRLGWGVKTLFRYDPDYWRLGIHRPKIKNKHMEDGFPDSVRWLNGSGQPMEDYFKFRGWRSIRRTVGYDWAQLNHYAIKSIDSYAIRKFRGNVNNKKDKYNADYWALQDRNEVRDDSVARHFPRRREIMAELLADPVLGPLHETALERVEARLAEFKATEAYSALKEGLLKASEVPITQVSAKPPKPRDPERIAALMSKVGKKEKAGNKGKTARAKSTEAAASPYLPGPVDLSSPVAIETVENRGLRLPADPRIFAPEALDAVLSGKFERRPARYFTRLTKKLSRLFEISDGFGFVALSAARDHADLRVMIQQDRQDIADFGREVAAMNGLAERVAFAGGSLTTESLGRHLREFRPDGLRLASAIPDPGILNGLDLSGIIRIFLSPGTDTPRGMAWDEALHGQGFAAADEKLTSGMKVYDRI